MAQPTLLIRFGIIIFSNENSADVFYNFLYIAGWFNLPSESLSRMNRKVQVRFLGDKGGVIRLSYPTNIYYENLDLLFYFIDYCIVFWTDINLPSFSG
jgi:hypothetical protein